MLKKFDALVTRGSTKLRNSLRPASSAGGPMPSEICWTSPWSSRSQLLTPSEFSRQAGGSPPHVGGSQQSSGKRR